MKKSKRIWSKPELIVMSRTRQEEAVLYWCKRIGGKGGPGLWGIYWDDCLYVESISDTCNLHSIS